MKPASWTAIAAALLTVAGLGGLYWYQQRRQPPPPEPAPVATAPAPAPAAPASEPAIRHPLPEPAAVSAPAPLVAVDAANPWTAVANDLVGRGNAVRFVALDDFARRLVVTVDNLARAHAAPRLWPLHPTPGRFSVVGEGEARTVAPTNPARYAPVVGMLAAVDARRVAAYYVQMYPRLQKVYEELGYPGKYFNDRVVDVIDHLLATPDPAEPLAITLLDIKGEVPSAQPWLRYEFADPALQSLSSGQKILLRVGSAHRATLKAKLRELRALISRAPLTR
ncbi:MAG: DUF3014 domain-containing protein [Burkholderiaceae bacterium]